MVELRDAVADDAPGVARIYIDSWNQGFGHLMGVRELTPERVARWRDDLMSPTAEWTVAELDGQVVGFVGVGPSRDPIDPTLGELNTIAVDPAPTGDRASVVHSWPMPSTACG
jgi:N-acetylglutamate synthase-like GNAT family acetyltransferase